MTLRIHPLWWPLLTLLTPVLVPTLLISNRRFKSNHDRANKVKWSAYDNEKRRLLEEIEPSFIVRPEVQDGREGDMFATPAPGSVMVPLPESSESLENSKYIFAEIVPTGDAPAEWLTPVLVFLRRDATSWELVGIHR